MNRTQAEASSTKKKGRRALRPRPAPRWLTKQDGLDPIAVRRFLMILSVLSGEKPVTTAITEHAISRPLYYQLETKACLGALMALVPGAAGASSPDQATVAHQLAERDATIAELEQQVRRLERQLFLTRKLVPAGPVAVPGKRGRPRGSGGGGRARSPALTSSTTPTSVTTEEASIRTKAGADAP